MPTKLSSSVFDTDHPRHWCPKSENYAGVDSLIAALVDGWTLSNRVMLHRQFGRSTSPVVIYYFELSRAGEVVTMPVVNSPRVRHIIETYNLQIVTEGMREVITV